MNLKHLAAHDRSDAVVLLEALGPDEHVETAEMVLDELRTSTQAHTARPRTQPEAKARPNDRAPTPPG